MRNKVLIHRPACGLILTVGEAMDRHIGVGVICGIEMCGHREIPPLLED